MAHMPYIQESSKGRHGCYGTNQSLPSEHKSHGILHPGPARETASKHS